MEALLGIDPGESGGVAILYPGRDVLVIKCPQVWPGIVDLVASIATTAKLHEWGVRAAIEDVHAFPARIVPCPHCEGPIRQPQGVKSVWTFATNYRTWQAALYVYGIQTKTVTPAVWQRIAHTLLPKKKPDRKKVLKRVAQTRYPTVIYRGNKPGRITDWNADALLILDWFKENQ